MIAVSIRNPVASEVVCGLTSLVCLDAGCDVPFDGRVLIHAASWFKKGEHSTCMHADVRDALIGVGWIDWIQQPTSHGTAHYTWRFKRTVVFQTPIPAYSHRAVFEYQADDELLEAVRTAITPVQALAKSHRPNPDSVHPRRRDGWVGD